MKKKQVVRPNRDPDHYSKRGVPYFWAPEWLRGTSADDTDHERLSFYVKALGVDSKHILTNNSGSYYVPCANYGKIHAVKENGDVNLYMKSKDGNLTYIRGSIQQEFKKWHTDREIDYILLGMDPDEILADEE